MKRFFLNYDLFLSGFITFIGLAGLVYFQFGMSPGPTGPFIFPKFSCFIIFIFGVLTMIDTIGEKHADTDPEVNILSVVLFGILSILYVLFFSRIGVITATFLFLVFSFSILSPKGVASLKSSIGYSAFLTFLLWIIFVRIFNIILPQCLLF